MVKQIQTIRPQQPTNRLSVSPFCGVGAETVKVISPVSKNFSRHVEKVLANGSRCTRSAGTAFENCAPGALLWCAFQTAIKIVYNLRIFTLHQTRWYADGHFFIALFCAYVQKV